MKLDYTKLTELSDNSGGQFKTDNYAAASEFCINLATSHYENFPVASILLPKNKRKHIAAVYAFARIADDIADENTDIAPDKRLSVLNEYASSYKQDNQTTNPIFLALRKTIEEYSIPYQPFDRLIEAFRQDINFKQPQSFGDLIDYCRFSANPVGEIVLRIFNNYNARTALMSDHVCTALQLANFWQDLSVDLSKGRVFIPKDLLTKYQVDEQDLKSHKNTQNLDKCINNLIFETEKIFEKGREISKFINNRGLRTELRATVYGGIKILQECKKIGSRLIIQRPKLKKSDLFIILLRSLMGI